jgi:hypothetical protein
MVALTSTESVYKENVSAVTYEATETAASAYPHVSGDRKDKQENTRSESGKVPKSG